MYIVFSQYCVLFIAINYFENFTYKKLFKVKISSNSYFIPNNELQINIQGNYKLCQ